MLTTVGYADFDVAIVFVSSKKMKELNKQYRNKDKVTDILSFPFHQVKPGEKIVAAHDDEKILGDLIICPEYTAHDAEQNWNCSYQERFTILLAHGIAHLLGHDHIDDNDFKQMQKVEKKMLNALSN